MTERDLLARARTDWRRLLAWALLVGATTAGLAFGVAANHRSITNRTLIVKRPSPCVELKGGRPSAGCERIARLVLRTCVLNPGLCSRAIDDARRLLPRAQRRRFERVLRELLPVDRGRRESGGKRQGSSDAPRDGSTPGSGGGGGASPPAGGGGSGQAGGGGSGGTPTPGRPSPSDAVNATKDRVRDSANDATDAVGAGRPVPPLPNVPPTPVLPQLVPPALCPRPPLC